MRSDENVKYIYIVLILIDMVNRSRKKIDMVNRCNKKRYKKGMIRVIFVI